MRIATTWGLTLAIGCGGAPAPGTPEDADSTDASATADAATTSWTPESERIVLSTGAAAMGLVADPTRARRLLIRLAGGTPPIRFAAVWTDGTFGPTLTWPSGETPFYRLQGSGGGFAADGSAHDYVASVSDTYSYARSTSADAGAAAWEWRDIPQIGSTWPPRSVAVMPTTPSRVFAKTDETLIEMTADPPQVTPLARRGDLSFSPDGTSFLQIDANEGTLYRCTLEPVACATVGPSGIDQGDTLTQVWIDPRDADQALVGATAQDGATVLYASSDRGESFTKVPLPGDPNTPKLWARSTNHPSTFAVQIGSELHVTSDRGATWERLTLPAGGTQLGGFAFDAVGTLFLISHDVLYSTTIP